MAITSGVPKCLYCGQRIPTISDKPFDGAIYPDWKGHNAVCKNHPLNKIDIVNQTFPAEGQEPYHQHLSFDEQFKNAFKNQPQEGCINMSKIIEARFTCNNASPNASGGKSVAFNAVYDSKGANALFSKATPNGQIIMSVDSETYAATEFERGVTYKVTFERVEHGE